MMRSAWTVLLAAVITAGAAVSTPANAEGQEKVVSLDKIPGPARTALIREAKGAPIVRVEVESDKTPTIYEGVIKQGDNEVGINVDAQGHVLGRHSEKGEKDEHK